MGISARGVTASRLVLEYEEQNFSITKKSVFSRHRSGVAEFNDSRLILIIYMYINIVISTVIVTFYEKTKHNALDINQNHR